MANKKTEYEKIIPDEYEETAKAKGIKSVLLIILWKSGIPIQVNDLILYNKI